MVASIYFLMEVTKLGVLPLVLEVLGTKVGSISKELLEESSNLILLPSSELVRLDLSVGMSNLLVFPIGTSEHLLPRCDQLGIRNLLVLPIGTSEHLLPRLDHPVMHNLLVLPVGMTEHLLPMLDRM